MTERSIFLALLEIDDPAERSLYLDRACAGDAALRWQVEQLLKAHEDPARFMDRPAPVLVATTGEPITERPGTMIGAYKLMEQIGEGGMGLVFVAEQQQPVRRKVALKVIKPGMDTRQVIARFEAERQALALMDHPNIAKVHDGGETASGRPYFVMELVKGVPITEYCDENRLTTDERLELFLPVCQAVQHAHQKGIIHRDIKPSNVLVASHDGVPAVKIIDFGVAKAVGQQLTERTLYTQFTQLIGTPLYMSPEQAGQSALDVDTRSDIYSLGVLLYELLTGTTPFDKERLREADYDEIRRIIREEEPPRPSTRISTMGQAATTVSAQRKSDPKRLSQLCRGELDWIVMKALEKDRNRRYETASALAADVQHYRHDEPVLACPPSALYRFGKFARRNRVTLGAASAIGLAVVLTTVVLAIDNAVITRRTQEKEEALLQKGTALDQARQEKDRADRNLAYAKKAVRDYLTATAADPRLKTADFQNLRKDLLATAVPFFEEFVRQKADDPQLEAERGESLLQLGSVREALGEMEKARDEYAQARAIFADLAAAHAEVPNYREALAVSLNNLGRALNDLRRPDEAEAVFREALAILDKLLAEDPEQPKYRQRMAKAYNELGHLLRGQGKLADERNAYRQAVAVLEKLVSDFPSVTEYRENLAVAQTNLANLLSRSGETDEGLRLHREVLATKADLVKSHPGNRTYRAGLASSYINLGFALEKLRKWSEAEAAYDQAITLWAQLVADFPSAPNYKHTLAMSYSNRAHTLKAQGQPVRAIADCRQAKAILETLVSDFPRNAEYRKGLGTYSSNLGLSLLSNGQPAEAEAAIRAAITVQEALAAEHPQDLLNAVAGAGMYSNLGSAMRASGRPEAALEWFGKAAATLEPLYQRQPELADARLFLHNAHWERAQTLMRLKRYREALPDWDRCFELSVEQERFRSRFGRLEALARSGDHVRATAEADALAKVAGATPEMLFDVACSYALSAAAARGDEKRVEQYAARAVELLRQAVAKGFNKADYMKKDPDLDLLRTREDFKKLIAELESKGK
jgi:serine/threonine protein kinase/tetratricopeptide (TPR) repeat protein